MNNELHKLTVVDRLDEFLKTHPLNETNIKAINEILHQINDGHVVLFDSKASKVKLSNSLVFVYGSDFLESCESCSPKLIKDRYTILKVNNESYKNWLIAKQFDVAASTSWGREYRLSRLLLSDSSNTHLSLKNRAGKIIDVSLNWKEERESLDIKNGSECVAGERINDSAYRVIIKSLWCDQNNTKTNRNEILNRFKDQWNKVSGEIKTTDKIVIDLRENGGGGDKEVEYILNSFFDKPTFLYRYRYLSATHPGGLKWIPKVLSSSHELWREMEFDYTNPAIHTNNLLYKNKLAVLISAGCFSSCEGIAQAFKNEKRAIIIGSTTHGGAGDPVIFPIKGTSYSINLPTCVVWQKNNLLFEGVGISPDIELFQNGQLLEDSLLSASLVHLQ